MGFLDPKPCARCGEEYTPMVDGGTNECDNCLTHCQHGTYIGFPGGPDYLCYWCEMGISREQMEEIYRAKAAYREKMLRHEIKDLYKLLDTQAALRVGQKKLFLFALLIVRNTNYRRPKGDALKARFAEIGPERLSYLIEQMVS